MNNGKSIILFIYLFLPITSGANIYIITHANTPIESISKEELASIFLLKKTYWDANHPITPIKLSAQSAVHQLFTQQVFKYSADKMETYWNKMSYRGATPPITQDSEDSVLSMVKRVPGAISYTSHQPIIGDVKILLVIPTGNKTQSIDIRSQLTLNIASFTYWPIQPDPKMGKTLKLCIFGSNSIHQSFRKFNNHKIHNIPLQIIHLPKPQNIQQCQLLYLTGLNQKKLKQLLLEIKDQPILTIGENRNFLMAGGMIRLEKKNGKTQFSINLSIVKQSGLRVSSRLLKLANIVDFPLLK